jgi:hypothetical protein
VVREDDTAYPAPIQPEPGRDIRLDEYSPQPADVNLTRGEVFVNSTDMILMESDPVQARVILTGNLPTPCHALRVVVEEADVENRIMIETYSVKSSDEICIQVLEPFEADIPLGMFSDGAFTVWINGEKAQSFELP